MTAVLKKVKNTIEKYGLLRPGERCILAVSGGADSTALLCLFRELAEQLSVELRVVHINHGLRGAEADGDENFVRELCRKSGLPFRAVSVDVKKLAAEKHLSTEEAARILRYEALENEAARWDAEAAQWDAESARWDAKAARQMPAVIAVAHHKEDHAETILMQLARGSGLRGVAGMAARRGRIIRPLLELSRGEIEAYLREAGMTWRTDSTNADTAYTRNRVRHDILPLLVREVNAGAVENITRAGNLIGEADRYFRERAERQLEVIAGRENRMAQAKIIGAGKQARTGKTEGRKSSADADLQNAEYIFPTKILQQLAPIEKSYLIRCALERILPGMKDLTAGHIEDILSLERAETGKHIDLPYQLAADRTYAAIRLAKKAAEEFSSPGTVTFRAFAYQGEEPPKETYRKWLDYDKIEEPMEVRYRQPGDRISLKNGSKALTALMTDEKIPREERDTVPLVAAGNDILWLIGYRIGEKYKINGSTRTVIEIKFEERA